MSIRQSYKSRQSSFFDFFSSGAWEEKWLREMCSLNLNILGSFIIVS